MARHGKARRLDCGAAALDRISNLPINVLHLILERLPLHDAARTATLSKTWRNIWVTHPHLNFDDIFFSRLVSKKEEQARLSEASITVSNILLVHSGPILKFHISIPHNLPLLYTDLWMKNLSSSGIKKLGLYNKAVTEYKMPSYLFSCLELTHLTLKKCILNPPLGLRGFCNLISVVLCDVTITKDMSFGTQLKTLDLQYCTGIEHLGCQFKYYSNLTKLIISSCGEIDWRWFECTKMVKNLDLKVGFILFPKKKIINLDKLLGNMPEIYSLSLDDHLLKRLEHVGTSAPKRLITTMVNLKNMHLSCVAFTDLIQIQYVLCLIRSSPNLQNLHISNRPVLTVSSSRVEQYLETPNLVDMVLEQLETVSLSGMEGSLSELHLIKLLLASSPLLRWMKLKSRKTLGNNPKEQLRILCEVTRLPRASPRAQIIWT